MKYSYLLITLVVVMLNARMASSIDDREALAQLDGIGFVQSGWYLGLDASHTLDDLQQAAEELQNAPIYVRLSAGRWLTQAISEGGTVDMPDYEARLGEHDLRRVAGRAAYYLEQAFGFDLATITPTASPSQLRHSQNVAGNCLPHIGRE